MFNEQITMQNNQKCSCKSIHLTCVLLEQVTFWLHRAFFYYTVCADNTGM
jgi:hypothetical protein